MPRWTDAQYMAFLARSAPASPAPSASSQREGILHDQVLSYCRAQGWPVVHSRMDMPTTTGIGTPDFVIALPGGRTLWIEAKSRKGKPTPAQLAWMALLRKLSHHTAIVRSLHEIIQQIRTIQSNHETH